MRPFAKGGRTRALTLFLLLSFTVAATAATERTLDVRSLLKSFGIGYVVDLFSTQLNDVINTLTLRTTSASREATKVVPIVSVGTGAYVGAAQVTGPEDRVALVEAVGQLEGDFFQGNVRAKALVPLYHKNPLRGVKRVPGVGVLAIVDLNVETPVVAPSPGGGSGGDVPSPPPDPDRDTPTDGTIPVTQGGYVLLASEEIVVSGNSNTFTGSIKAGDEVEISGNNNAVTGWIESGDDVEVKAKGGKNNHAVRRAEWTESFWLPSFDADRWRRRAHHRYRGDTRFQGLRVDGILFVDGDASLSGDLRGSGVLAVDGDVRIDARSIDGPDILIVPSGDVIVSRSNARIDAAIVAEDGEIRMDGSHIRFSGVLAAEKIHVRGNSGRYAFDGSTGYLLD